MLERLQKIISRAGIASRRRAEQLILSGAVTVNGHVVTELGTKADADRDHIAVGPRVVRMDEAGRDRYFAFNKPTRVVSTLNDPEGRPCLGPYVRAHKGRLFPVGRLEFDAAGVLILTSDGELASDLMRAAGALPQTWRFKVKGRIDESVREAIERDAQARVRMYRDGANAWYEGRLRNAPRDLLRQSLQRHGVLLEKMVRAEFAGIELAQLPAGHMRELSAAEVATLRRATQGRAEPVHAPREVRAGAAARRGTFAVRKKRSGAGPAWRGGHARGQRPWSGSRIRGARQKRQGGRAPEGKAR